HTDTSHYETGSTDLSAGQTVDLGDLENTAGAYFDSEENRFSKMVENYRVEGFESSDFNIPTYQRFKIPLYDITKIPQEEWEESEL
ncbi:MAG: hypothetical protein RI995_869, partial [Bacteroidota bacterium]